MQPIGVITGTRSGERTNPTLTDRKIKRHLSAITSGTQPLKTALVSLSALRQRRPRASVNSGGPSAPRPPAAAAFSKTWRGIARPGHATQDRVGLRLRFLGTRVWGRPVRGNGWRSRQGAPAYWFFLQEDRGSPMGEEVESLDPFVP